MAPVWGSCAENTPGAWGSVRSQTLKNFKFGTPSGPGARAKSLSSPRRGSSVPQTGAKHTSSFPDLLFPNSIQLFEEVESICGKVCQASLKERVCEVQSGQSFIDVELAFQTQSCALEPFPAGRLAGQLEERIVIAACLSATRLPHVAT